MKSFVLLISAYFLCLFGGGNSIIYWNETSQVTWKDFKGTPNMSSKFGATSKVGIIYNTEFLKNGDVEVTIQTIFSKKESWVKPNEQTENLLIHENVHFDIAEVYSRKFRKSILLDKMLVPKRVNKKTKEMYKFFNEELRKRQDLYDSLTNYSINKEEQLLWYKIIKKELSDLSEYKKEDILIRNR